jgi:hypothetical protein
MSEELPADAFWLSRSGHLVSTFQNTTCFFIETSDYHTGPVSLQRTEIIELLNIRSANGRERKRLAC